MTSKDDTEKFSIRDFVRKRNSDVEGEWWKLRDVKIKNTTLAIKGISLSLDWELEGDPHANNRFVIILVKKDQELHETVLFGEEAKKLGYDDNNELRLNIPAELQDTRKEKITVEIPEDHEILEEWKEGYDFKFKAFINSGNRLKVHEFRY